MSKYLQDYINDFNIIGLSLTNPVYDSLNIKDTYLELLPNEIFQYIKQLSIRTITNFTSDSIMKYLCNLRFNYIKCIILQINNTYHIMYSITNSYHLECIYSNIIQINDKFMESIFYHPRSVSIDTLNNEIRIKNSLYNEHNITSKINNIIIYELYKKDVNSHIGRYLTDKIFAKKF